MLTDGTAGEREASNFQALTPSGFRLHLAPESSQRLADPVVSYALRYEGRMSRLSRETVSSFGRDALVQADQCVVDSWRGEDDVGSDITCSSAWASSWDPAAQAASKASVPWLHACAPLAIPPEPDPPSCWTKPIRS